MRENYIKLLKSTKREGIDRLINHLETTDFFTAPASTKYHGNYEGGLMNHSISVYNVFLKKVYDLGLKLAPRSIIIISLLHDICKVNFYIKSLIWHKLLGKWESYPGYKVENQFPIGHGEKSIIILQDYIKLTNTELMCIRWHMGIFDLSESQKRDFYNACKLYPEIVAFHTSDYESSTYLETTK